MPTLDDLAAQLAALGWEIEHLSSGSIAATHETGPHDPTSFVRILVSPSGIVRIKEMEEGERTLSVHFYAWVWAALDAIKSWQQSGARPEPVGAERVTQAMSEAAARAVKDRWGHEIGSLLFFVAIEAALAERDRERAALAGDTK